MDDFTDLSSAAVNAAVNGQAPPKAFNPSASYGTPPRLLDNLMTTESSGDAHAVNPQSGAMGAYQFMPSTLAMLSKQGVKFDPFSPQQSRAAADYYINQLVQQNGGDYRKAMAQYGGFKTKDPSAYVGKVLNGVMLPGGAQTQQQSAQPGALDDFSSAAIDAAARQAMTAAAPATSADSTVESSPVAGNNFFQNAQLGVGHGMVSAAEHVKQGIDESANWLHSKLEGTPIGSGLDWLGQKTGLPTPQQVLANTNQNIAETNRLDAPIMATTGGKIGNLIGQVGVAAPTVLIPGANTYTGASLIGAGTGLATTAGGLSDRLAGAAYGALGGFAGKGAGDLIGAGATKLSELRSQNLVQQQAANQTRDAAVQLALQSGYKLPPQEVNPGMLNGLLEGLSGKIKTSQSASAQNQSLTNSLVKRDLGISDDVPLTPQTLQSIRAQAGKAYQAVKGVGTITADQPYLAKLDGIASQYDKASQSFPGFAKPEITNLVSAFKQPQFDSGAAIDAIKMLRDQGNTAFRNGDTGLAKANTGIASALEDVIDRNLQSSGDPALLSNYRDARQMIAKTYSVERALNPATGDVNAADLAKQLQKGKPLSGNLKTVGTVASAFPKATQALKQNYNPVSPLDYAMGLIGAVHNPVEGISVLARPAVRAAILSKPYQALNALGSGNYGGGLVSNAIYPALASRPLSDLLRVGGPVAAVQSQQ